MEEENVLGVLKEVEERKNLYRGRMERLQARVEAHNVSGRDQYTEIAVSMSYLTSDELEILEVFLVKRLNAKRQVLEAELSVL